MLTRHCLRDFVGLENTTAAVKKALMDFSFYIAIGNTDEAYKAISGVKSRIVWESLARMCVKTRRLDVVQKCLGQMGSVRAAS